MLALQESLKFVEEQRVGLDLDYEFDLISEAIAAMREDAESIAALDFTFCGTGI